MDGGAGDDDDGDSGVEDEDDAMNKGLVDDEYRW